MYNDSCKCIERAVRLSARRKYTISHVRNIAIRTYTQLLIIRSVYEQIDFLRDRFRKFAFNDMCSCNNYNNRQVLDRTRREEGVDRNDRYTRIVKIYIIIDVLHRLHLSETLTTVHEVDAAWYCASASCKLCPPRTSSLQ